LPQGGVAVHGTAAIVQNGTTLNVNTTNGAGNRSIINWQSFNIGAGHTTNINQPNAQSSSLNRVISNTPSQIYGTLRSNGQVILVNQNGIAVGAGGVVDTAGFTASTLNITDADYKAKRLRFEGNALSGGVVLEGEDRSDPNNIRAGAMVRSANGDVQLFAPQVSIGKGANVKADNGNVIVGAGQSVEVTGRGLEGVKFLIQGADHKAINLGTLQGNAVGVFAGTLRHSGVIQAQQATLEGGRVVLRAIKDVEIVKDASLAHAPIISANGGVNPQGVAQSGGNVRIESAQGNIIIGTGAQISANAGSSAAGQNLTPNQQIALVNAAGGAITIIANEGRVITEAGSQISATGSPGGIIKIYGGQEARVASVINASSPSLGAADAAGTLQLINAANSNALMGGTIQILSPELVHLATGAQLLASGDAGGGTILVGGDYQGANAAITNAQNTNVSSGVLLEANARVNGNGGKVIVWADNDTYFAGTLHAKGGEQGGDGGFGETSGKKNLYLRGRADLSARRGRTGTLLLDPESIYIQGGTGTSDDTDGIVNAGDGSNIGTNYTIHETVLEGLNADITLEAANYIQFQGTFTGDELTLNKSFTLRTRNDPTDTGTSSKEIYLGGWGNSTFGVRAGGDISIRAGSAWAGGAAGAPSITSAGGFTLTSTSGNVSLEARGDLSLNPGVTVSASSGHIILESNLGNVGLGFSAGAPLSLSAKSVQVISDAAGGEISINGSGTKIEATAGSIGITADRLQVETTASGMLVTATAGVNLRPFTANRAIHLGGSDALPSATELGIEQAEWDKLRTGSTSIFRIGDTSTYTGNIVINESGGFSLGSSEAALLSNGGSITQTTPLSANQLRMEAGSITLNQSTNDFYQVAAKTTTGAINLTTGSLNTSVSTVDGLSGLTSASTLALSNTNLSPSNLNLENAANISSEGDISIQAFETLTVFGGNYTIDSNTDNTGSSGKINLGTAKIEGSTTGRGLTLDSSTAQSGAKGGEISFGNVGSSQALNKLILNSNAPVAGDRGEIKLPSNITVSGAGGSLQINGLATMSVQTSLAALSGSTVTLQGEVQGTQNLTINADGAVNLQAEMGTGTQIANLVVTSNGVLTVSNRIKSGANVELTANGTGSLLMSATSEIELIGTGGSLSLDLSGGNGVQLSKIIANTDYSANVKVGTSGAAISTVNGTYENFTGGLDTITFGSSGTPANIGTAVNPIKFDSYSGSGTQIYAYGNTGTYLSNESNHPIRLQFVEVGNGAVSTLSVKSKGDLYAGNVTVNSGSASIDLFTEKEFMLGSIDANSSALSAITLSAGTTLNLGEGIDNIRQSKVLYLQGSNTQGFDFVDTLATAPAAGTLHIALNELDAIGSSVGHVVIGRTDLTGGSIRFTVPGNIDAGSSGSKNYSFFSGGSISSLTPRSINVASIGFNAVGDISLGNVDLINSDSLPITLAAKAGNNSNISLAVNNSAGVSIDTVGGSLPVAQQIKAISTSGTGGITLVNSSGGVFSGAETFDLYAGSGHVTVKAYQDIGTVANPIAIHGSGFTLGNVGGGVFQNLIAVDLTRNSSSSVLTSETSFDTGNQVGDSIYLKAGTGMTLELDDGFATNNVINRTLSNATGNIRVTEPNVTFSGVGGSLTLNANSTTFETITTLTNLHTVNITGNSTLTSGAGGWLQGSGTINNSTGTLLVNGTISPGTPTSIGTINLLGGLQLGTTGLLDLQINTTATDGDKLVIGGAFNAGGGTLSVSENAPLSTNLATSYVLASIGGAVSGAFATVTSATATLLPTLTAGPAGLLTVNALNLYNSWSETATTDDWHLASNWTRGVVPTAAQDVRINVSAANRQVSISSAGANARSILLSGDDDLNIVGGQTLSLAGASSSTIGASGAGLNLNAGIVTQAAAGGTLTVLAGGQINSDGASTIGLTEFTNNGSVNVLTGTLVVLGKGTDLGSYSIANASQFVQASGARTLASSSGVSGAGLFKLTGGSVDVLGTFTASSLAVTGGTFLVDTPGTGISLSSLNVSGGLLQGADDFSVTNNFNFSGGQLGAGGTLSTAVGSLSLLSNSTTVSRDWTNSGNVSLTAGSTSLTMGGMLTNQAAGIITVDSTAAGSVINLSNATSTINNLGTIDWRTGVTSSIGGATGAQLNNSGSLNVSNTNTSLSIASNVGFSQTGIIDLQSGAIFSRLGGFTNAAAALIRGSGTLEVSGAGLTNLGTLSPGGSGSIGQLKIVGNADLSAGKVMIELDSLANYDQLDIAGQLVTSPSMTIALSEISPFVAVGNTFIPISYTGTQSGGLPTVDSAAISGKTFSLTSASAFASAFTLTAAAAALPPSTDIFWDGGGDGSSWADPINWSTDLLPIAGQKVTLNPAGSGSITLSSGAFGGFSGIDLDATDQLFITGGSLALPSSNLALNGAIHLQGGTLTGNATGGVFGNTLFWSGGTFSGAGAYSASALNLAGSGARVLSGVALSSATPTLNLGGGSLVLQSGAQLGAGSSAFTVNPLTTLSFAGGGLASASLTNNGTVRIDTGLVSLNNSLLQGGQFVVANGATMSFANNVSLGGQASVVGGTWIVAANTAVTTQGSLDRGLDGVTFVNGNLTLGGDFQTQDLNMGAGAQLVGGGKALRVLRSWNDAAIGTGSITGLGSATVHQASGDLSLGSEWVVSGDVVLSAPTGSIIANVKAGALNAAASKAVTLAGSANSAILSAQNVQLGLNAVSLDVSGPLAVVASGNITQGAAVNVGGLATLSSSSGDIVLTNIGNDFNQLAFAATNLNLSDKNDLLIQGIASNEVLLTVGKNLNSLGPVQANLVTLNAGRIGSSSAPFALAAGKVSVNTTQGDAVISNTKSANLLGASVAGSLNYSAAGQDINIGANSVLAVNVNASNGITLLGKDFMIGGGAEANASTKINGNTGGVTITASGNVTLLGGAKEGTSTRIDAAGAVNVLVGGTLNLIGGSGQAAYVQLDPIRTNPMNVNASSVNIVGGSGDGAFAAMVSDGDITVNTASLNMQGGTGTGADAVIISNFGVVTAPACNGCSQLAGQPFTNSAVNVGFFSGSAVGGGNTTPPAPAPAPGTPPTGSAPPANSVVLAAQTIFVAGQVAQIQEVINPQASRQPQTDKRDPQTTESNTDLLCQ
jgi:filamentous hemagglutinin family protein